MTFLGEDPRLRAIHETLKAARAPRPRVAILRLGDPMTTIGPWVTEVIRRAGGIDLFASGETSREAHPVDVATLQAADPELIVLTRTGMTLGQLHEALAHRLTDPDWAWARTRRVLAMDATWLDALGPSLIDAVASLAPSIAPTLFAPAPTHRVRAITLSSD
jgi:ABC-type Fe3+-hydroxamate transport system substrate-binding protein